MSTSLSWYATTLTLPPLIITLPFQDIGPREANGDIPTLNSAQYKKKWDIPFDWGHTLDGTDYLGSLGNGSTVATARTAAALAGTAGDALYTTLAVSGETNAAVNQATGEFEKLAARPDVFGGGEGVTFALEGVDVVLAVTPEETAAPTLAPTLVPTLVPGETRSPPTPAPATAVPTAAPPTPEPARTSTPRGTFVTSDNDDSSVSPWVYIILSLAAICVIGGVIAATVKRRSTVRRTRHRRHETHEPKDTVMDQVGPPTAPNFTDV